MHEVSVSTQYSPGSMTILLIRNQLEPAVNADPISDQHIDFSQLKAKSVNAPLIKWCPANIE